MLAANKLECPKCNILGHQLHDNDEVCRGQLFYKDFKPTLLLRKLNLLYRSCCKHLGTEQGP